MATQWFFNALMGRNCPLLSKPSGLDDTEPIAQGSSLFRNREGNPSLMHSLSPEVEDDDDLNRIWNVGSSSVVGGRPKQEDAFVVAPNHGLIGVFDGHMGPAAASFCSQNLVKIHQQNRPHQTPHLPQQTMMPEELEQKHKRELTATFFELDRQFRASHLDLSDGTTACVVFGEEISSRNSDSTSISSPLKKTILSIANTGDSRAIVIKLGNPALKMADSEILVQTKDHKPLEESEFNRIKAAGGWVTSNRRLGGVLLTSRSIGAPLLKDSESSAARIKPVEELDPELVEHVAPNPRFYKDITKGLICDPDVISVEIDEGDEIAVIVASDGLWDVLNCESAKEILIDTINRHRHDAPGDTLARIVAEDLVNVAVSRRTADNTTAVVALRMRKNPRYPHY